MKWTMEWLTRAVTRHGSISGVRVSCVGGDVSVDCVVLALLAHWHFQHGIRVVYCPGASRAPRLSLLSLLDCGGIIIAAAVVVVAAVAWCWFTLIRPPEYYSGNTTGDHLGYIRQVQSFLVNHDNYFIDYTAAALLMLQGLCISSHHANHCHAKATTCGQLVLNQYLSKIRTTRLLVRSLLWTWIYIRTMDRDLYVLDTFIRFCSKYPKIYPSRPGIWQKNPWGILV